MQTSTVVGKLGKVVKGGRTALGYTVTELASLSRCGVSERTIRRLESSVKTGYNPKLGTLIMIANGLNIPVEDLIREIRHV